MSFGCAAVYRFRGDRAKTLGFAAFLPQRAMSVTIMTGQSGTVTASLSLAKLVGMHAEVIEDQLQVPAMGFEEEVEDIAR